MADSPLIGIYPTMVPDYYVAYEKWVAQAGGRTVVLPRFFAHEPQALERLFASLNGLLIPGGGDFVGNGSVDAMVARATRANREGDYFPIWGTCLGFEYLVDILGGPGALVPRAPGDPIVPGFDSELLPRALNLTAAVRGSRMLGGASDALLRWAARENVTYNMHHRGVEPASFASNPRLDSSMSLLASSTDRRGRPFVAAFEGDNLPFYGVQFHPEKIEFVPPSRYEPNIPRTPHAAALSRHLGSFLVSEAAKSLHRAATRTPTAANPFVWPSPSAVFT